MKTQKNAHPLMLLTTAFIGGMAIMALEMTASRLLAPFFGTSLFVWTNIIGITMISLTLGYYYGGRAADKKPYEKELYQRISAAALLILALPFIAQQVMELSIKAVSKGSPELFYGSLLATILLFAPPLTLLAAVSPYCIRLTARDREGSGYTAGRIFAISTIGSIIGTFLPVLFFIPFIGTKKTLLFFAAVLIFTGVYGLGKRKEAFLITIGLLLLSPMAGGLKEDPHLIFEKESVHNYIQVIENHGTRYLELNEGYAYHSIYDPDTYLVGGIWDYFNLLPMYNPGAKKALIIGLAAGTTARQYRRYHPSVMIDGVEIDGDIIKAGNSFFDMAGPNLHTYEMDGRAFLRTSEGKYDIVIVDAYRQPYIPFHLTTKEFFNEVKGRMNPRGIMAINVASVKADSRLLKALVKTLGAVYNYVYILNPDGTLNYLVMASDHQLPDDLVKEGLDPDLKTIAQEAELRIHRATPDKNIPVLTDDQAPVELYTDLMIFSYIQKGETQEYTRIFE